MALPVDSEVHELKLGNSFDPQAKVGFHSIRYDFKPASVDTSKEACVEVGEGNQVTVTVPHVEGSGISHTVFKGNKQPLMKECVLIIDHNTGTYTLEKLTSKIAVKKTRLDGSSKAMQHITGRMTPVDKKSSSGSSSSKSKSGQKNSPDPHNTAVAQSYNESVKGDDSLLVGEITDSSDDDNDDDDNDDDIEPRRNVTETSQKKTPSVSSSQMGRFGVLDDDLALSESDSDSD